MRAEWIFLAINLCLEILSVACDQASSPRRPHFALFGMLLAIAALLISIGELICRGQRERAGTLPDIYGLVAGISQCICSIVQYVYCLRHADSPLKASLLPAIFLICLVGSRLSNKRMNANTTDNMDSWENSSSTEETLLHPQIRELRELQELRQLQELQQLRELRYIDLSQVQWLEPQQLSPLLRLELPQILQLLQQGLPLPPQRLQLELPHLPHMPNLQHLYLPLKLRPKED